MQCVGRFMMHIGVSTPVFRRTSLRDQREIAEYIYIYIYTYIQVYNDLRPR